MNTVEILLIAAAAGIGITILAGAVFAYVIWHSLSDEWSKKAQDDENDS